MPVLELAISTTLAGLAAVSAVILYAYLRSREWKKPWALGFAVILWLILALIKEAIMDYASYLLE